MIREIKFRVWHRKEQKLYYRGYQKWFYVLLCEDDRGTKEGKGIPVKRAGYSDCEFFETTSLFDKNGIEVFEGDIIKITTVGHQTFQSEVGEVPDMFRSRNIHPLQSIFEQHGIREEDVKDMEVVGNGYGVLCTQ